MADNWSSSVVTLAGSGDWIVWEIDLDSDTVDELNGVDGTPFGALAVRAARTATPDPPDEDLALVIVNDLILVGTSGGVFGYGTFPTGSAWDPDAKFLSISATPSGLVYYGVPVINVPDYPWPIWKVGTNTIRVVNVTGVALDIDAAFLLLRNGGGGAGETDSAETTPSNYATHVDGDDAGDIGLALLAGSTDPLWLMRAPDGATGSYAHGTTIDVEHFCVQGDITNLTLHLHDGATDAYSEVLVFQSGGTDVPTRSAQLGALVDGVLEFEGVSTGWFGSSSGIQPETAVLYGGSPDGAFPPAFWNSLDYPLRGCSGWKVGSIGIGP